MRVGGARVQEAREDRGKVPHNSSIGSDNHQEHHWQITIPKVIVTVHMMSMIQQMPYGLKNKEEKN